MTATDFARSRMVEAARRHAAADRTDPFTYLRALTHIENGVASINRGPNQEYDTPSGPAFYDAEPSKELRKVTGYAGREMVAEIMTFRNVVRP